MLNLQTLFEIEDRFLEQEFAIRESFRQLEDENRRLKERIKTLEADIEALRKGHS